VRQAQFFAVYKKSSQANCTKKVRLRLFLVSDLKESVKAKVPPICFAPQGGDRRSTGLKMLDDPRGLNAFPRAFKSCKVSGRSPDFEFLLRVSAQKLITVARPRGIFTRFPILPNPGHPETFNYKEL